MDLVAWKGPLHCFQESGDWFIVMKCLQTDLQLYPSKTVDSVEGYLFIIYLFETFITGLTELVTNQNVLQGIELQRSCRNSPSFVTIDTELFRSCIQWSNTEENTRIVVQLAWTKHCNECPHLTGVHEPTFGDWFALDACRKFDTVAFLYRSVA